ncbi:hypothetical protein HOB95_04265, partial [bacterium]|nr:hypothetical protein [bacterium]
MNKRSYSLFFTLFFVFNNALSIDTVAIYRPNISYVADSISLPARIVSFLGRAGALLGLGSAGSFIGNQIGAKLGNGAYSLIKFGQENVQEIEKKIQKLPSSSTLASENSTELSMWDNAQKVALTGAQKGEKVIKFVHDWHLDRVAGGLIACVIGYSIAKSLGDVIAGQRFAHRHYCHLTELIEEYFVYITITRVMASAFESVSDQAFSNWERRSTTRDSIPDVAFDVFNRGVVGQRFCRLRDQHDEHLTDTVHKLGFSFSADSEHVVDIVDWSRGAVRPVLREELRAFSLYHQSMVSLAQQNIDPARMAYFANHIAQRIARRLEAHLCRVRSAIIASYRSYRFAKSV